MPGSIPRCNICNARDAEYVCRECGRLACRFDFDPYLSICSKCRESREPYRRVEPVSTFTDYKGLILVAIGIVMILIGFLLMALPGLRVPTEGGLIIIGPFPPIVMSGEYALWLGIIYLLVFIGIIFLIFWYFTRLVSRGL